MAGRGKPVSFLQYYYFSNPAILRTFASRVRVLSNKDFLNPNSRLSTVLYVGLEDDKKNSRNSDRGDVMSLRQGSHNSQQCK